MKLLNVKNLLLIYDAVLTAERPPLTLREISATTGLNTARVWDGIRVLARYGHVSYRPGVARSIAPIQRDRLTLEDAVKIQDSEHNLAVLRARERASLRRAALVEQAQCENP